MQFLRDALTNSAKDVPLGFTVNAENYKPLWDALVKKYEHKYAMACAYLSKFFGLPTVKSPATSGDLDKMISTTNEMLRQMKEMEYQTENWDLILVHALQERLDRALRNKWTTECKDATLPTIEAMLKFLEEQSKQIGSFDFSNAALQIQAANDRVHRMSLNARTGQRSRTEQGAAGSSSGQGLRCLACDSSSHLVRQCPEFAPLTYDDRKRTAAINRWCFLCLKKGHFIHECYSLKRCQQRRCREKGDVKHHEMLCPEGARFVSVAHDDRSSHGSSRRSSPDRRDRKRSSDGS